MGERLLAAFTAMGSSYLPPYLNATRLHNGDVRLTVRGTPRVTRYALAGETGAPVHVAPEASIDIAADEWRRIVGELLVSEGRALSDIDAVAP